MNLNDIHAVRELAEGDAKDRSHIDTSVLRRTSVKTLKSAVELLELSYLQFYLEGKIHCDVYHEAKAGFADLGLSYGYINTFVRQDAGTNCFRFAYRRPAANGYLIRENIRMTKKGYTRTSFRRAGHEYEVDLAEMTEEHYARLRESSKIVRSAIRKLKTHPHLLNVNWQA